MFRNEEAGKNNFDELVAQAKERLEPQINSWAYEENGTLRGIRALLRFFFSFFPFFLSCHFSIIILIS